MNVLVWGGAASGKSAHAERLACRLSPVRYYLATMADDSPEAHTRIERHRRQRSGASFDTIECTGSLHAACDPRHPRIGVALLDDLGNLLARALFGPDGSMADPTVTLERLDQELIQLFESYEHTVVVGCEVGADRSILGDTTQEWVRLMGTLGCRIAARADSVIEVCAGIPHTLKGQVL